MIKNSERLQQDKISVVKYLFKFKYFYVNEKIFEIEILYIFFLYLELRRTEKSAPSLLKPS